MSNYKQKYSYVVIYREGNSNFSILEIDNKTNQVVNTFEFERKIKVMVD